MTEIAVRQTPPQGVNLPDKIQYARALADSNLLPKQYQKQPANLLFALEYADALGVSPIHAITSIHVIDGRPSASADLIASLVRRAGHRLRITGDDEQAVAQIVRADDPGFTFEAKWTMAKARAAGLAGKGVWKSYPAAMLRSRAITEVARMAAPDALFGVIYTPEELGVPVDSDGSPVAAPPTRGPEPLSGTERLRATLASPPPATAPEAPSGPEPITPKQLTGVNAGMTDLGITDRTAKLAWLGDQLGRPIGSSRDVTKGEAHELMDGFASGRFTPAVVEAMDAEIVEDPPMSYDEAYGDADRAGA